MPSRAVVCLLAWTMLLAGPASAQPTGGRVSIAARSFAELRGWDQRVDAMLRDGELRVRNSRPDTLLGGRTHQRADQFFRGVRVFGGDVARQLDGGGATISLFGVLYEGIALDTTPALDADAAIAIVEARAGVTLGESRRPELVVLPLDAGGYALAWRLRAAARGDIRQYFVDARSGAVVLDYSDLKTQNRVGKATGVLGDPKKISVQSSGGRFYTTDELRPPSIETYDMQGNVVRTENFLNGVVFLGQNDVASDSDNVWTDGAVDDAHVYAGWTYDFYFKRFGRNGLDNHNIEIRSLVHPVRRTEIDALYDTYPDYFTNAFYAGDGIMVYGVGLPAGFTLGGQVWDYMSGALDIVAHELTHGVTDYTSGLIYRGESGALNEAFSDIMGTAAEFYFQPAGSSAMHADYLIGEDVVRPGGFRSMENPQAFGDPDHYSSRFLGNSDNGGVHTNSGIANQAYYLAVEGGTNRTSGLAVQGVGQSNREQIEKTFYRAFTELLPSNATFATARAATIQAARDLYGANSAAERAVTQAWTAVGVN
jgi:Zn-dependent metalloprotease